MAIYRHAGLKFFSEWEALESEPLRIGDEITRAATHDSAFLRWYEARVGAGVLGWVFVGKHRPCLDSYAVMPVAAVAP